MKPDRAERIRSALQQIDQLILRGRFAEAEALSRPLVTQNQLSSAAHFMLGLSLQGQGRFEQAEPSLARAVTLDGKNTAYLLNHGLCLLSMGRVAEAAQQYRKARSVAPSAFEPLWRTGSFLARIGHTDAAVKSLEQAIARAPDGARPAIRLELLDGLLSLGRTEDAEAHIARFIGETPFAPRYLCLLSGLQKHEPGSEMFRRVEAMLARPNLSPVDRSDLMLRIGAMLQQGGRHDEAFATFTAAKKLLRAPSVTAAFTAEVDQRIAAFDAAKIARLAELYGTSRYRPVFVVGLPRSGTTLAAQIISAHSAAGNAGELETMTYCAALMANGRPLAEIEAALAARGRDGVVAVAALYESAMRVVVPERERPVDKMPMNFRFLAEAAILFPAARFVHCTRHPADTFISALQTEMNAAHSYSYDPADYAAHHRQYRRLMAHWEQVLPGRIFTLAYERLVTEPEATISALLAHLDLGMEEACLHPERNAGAVTTFSRLQVRSGINASSVGRWKPYARHLGSILEGADV